MHYLLKKQVIDLYCAGCSANEISKKHPISIWTVYKILRRNNIPRRSSSDTNRLIFLSKPLSFVKRKKLTPKQKKIWQAGSILYLGEGSKRNKDTVDLANSDPEVIKVFLKMLREVYGVNEQRLRVLIYCHEGSNINNLIKYWSGVTKISPNQFTKPYIKTGFVDRKNDKMSNGLVHIRYSDRRLWDEVMQDIKNLVGDLLG